MNCPPEVAAIILEMLTHGLLRARMAGWDGNADVAALEADHLHNLPGLLAKYSPDLVRYYWDAERPSYIQRCMELGRPVSAFQPLWDQLAKHLPAATNAILAK